MPDESPDLPTRVGSRTPEPTISLTGADFRRLAHTSSEWISSERGDFLEPVNSREFSDRYDTWAHIYWFGDNWPAVVLARTYLDSTMYPYEIVWDTVFGEGSYAILTDYNDPSCGNCPSQRADGKFNTPPKDFLCHNTRPDSGITCRQVFDRNYTTADTPKAGEPDTNVGSLTDVTAAVGVEPVPQSDEVPIAAPPAHLGPWRITSWRYTDRNEQDEVFTEDNDGGTVTFVRAGPFTAVIYKYPQPFRASVELHDHQTREAAHEFFTKIKGTGYKPHMHHRKS